MSKFCILILQLRIVDLDVSLGLKESDERSNTEIRAGIGRSGKDVQEKRRGTAI